MSETAAPTPRRSNQAIAACVLSALAFFAIDIATKHWAEQALSRPREGSAPPVCEEQAGGYIPYQRLRGTPVPVIENMLEFEYAENCGAAFGMMRGFPYPVRAGVFGTAAIAAVIVMLSMFAKGQGGPFFAWCVPFVVAGALGNLHDRVRYRYVVDFIHVFYEPWSFDYPTFNVADIVIVIGVALMILDFTFGPKASGAPAKPAEKPSEDGADTAA